MRVVGCDWPSIPMRTPLTPAATTAMWVCPVAITVSGRSTTTRAGESRALSFGVSVPLELISTRMSSVLRTTLTRSRWTGDCATAAAATNNTSNDTNSVTCCFRISPLPTRGPWPACPSSKFVRRPGSPIRRTCLNRRREDSLHYFSRERLAQLVLNRFLENNRITRDLHHIAVEHGIVLPQKICFVQIVGHHCDKTGV